MVAVTIPLDTRAVWQVWMFKFIDVKISTSMHTSIFATSNIWFISQNAIKCKFSGKCARFQRQRIYASYFISKNSESILVILNSHTRLVGRRTTVVASECMYIVQYTHIMFLWQYCPCFWPFLNIKSWTYEKTYCFLIRVQHYTEHQFIQIFLQPMDVLGINIEKETKYNFLLRIRY